MAYYSDVPFVMITSPTEARAIDHSLTLLIEQHRRNGEPCPPLRILQLQSASSRTLGRRRSQSRTKPNGFAE